MPRYFLHLRTPGGFIEDEDGSEMASLEEARAEAVRGIRSILSDAAKSGCIDLRWRLEVTDAEGAVLLTLPFRDAIALFLEEAQP